MSYRPSATPLQLLAIATWVSMIGTALSLRAADEPSVEPAHDVGLEMFEREIRPLLERRCYACHSHAAGKARGGLVLDSREGWVRGGSEGPAIIPGDPDHSPLILAVRRETFEMPPDEALTVDEVAQLTRWVAAGAPDPREAQIESVDPARLWAWQPITSPKIPSLVRRDWPAEAADAFIGQVHERLGLEPAVDAERHTWLRRVTFDLTGLPPTPREISDFLNDRAPNAHEHVVDRLLQTPAFGDHWARHWFDLSCYADLADIQGNVLIREAWRYRDYVIDALNADKPFDQFIQEQIAGDLLPYDNLDQRREQLVATGFLAIGPWTLQNYIKGQLEADVIDHQIDRIGRTFLGQTLACARCHDHKFDPIPTADYYALAGIFHNTQTTRHAGPGVWSQITHVALPVSPTQSADFEQRKQRIETERVQLNREWTQRRTEVDASRFKSRWSLAEANALTSTQPVDANTLNESYQLTFVAAPTVWADGSQATSNDERLVVQLLRSDGSVLTHFIVHAGVWTESSSEASWTPMSFDYVGDGTGPLTLHITASDATGRFSGAIDDLQIVHSATANVVFHDEFAAVELGPTQGSQFQTGRPVFAQCVVPGWNGAGVNHSHVVNRGDQVQPNLAVQIFSGSRTESSDPHLASIERRLHELSGQLSAADPRGQQCLAVQDIDTPRDWPIYRRGDFQSPGDVIPRGFLRAAPQAMASPISTHASGRLELSQWLTDRSHPLPARVLVNRIWHHLFGTGLVRSVDYFGAHGDAPSHPELLDYLAIRFRDTDAWSLKATVRRLVLSRTYRMASLGSTRGPAVDPENRWLWQMPRRRMPAESIRDAMLSVAGVLDPRRGGPSLGLELAGNIQGLGDTVNPPTWVGQIPDNIRHRRSVYLPSKRERPTGELEILSVFDAPHPNDITGARAQTTVALQALFLLNSPWIKQVASELSQRVRHDKPETERARIEHLYLLTLGRPATGDEISASIEFLDDSLQEFAATETPANAHRMAWNELCHALLCSNAFLFRE